MSAHTAFVPDRTLRQTTTEHPSGTLTARHPRPAAHPPDDILQAYRTGELPEETQEKLRDHLVFCEDCSRKVLDLAIFFDGAPRQGRVDPDELVDAWNELVRNLEQEGR